MNKNLKKIIAMASVLAITASVVPIICSINAYADDLTVDTDDKVEAAEKLGKLDRVTVNYKQFLYEENNGTLKAIKYLGSDTCVDVPDQVNGTKVTAVADDVFDNATSENLAKITEFKISGKLEKISSKVFEKLSNLKSISLRDNYDSKYQCENGVLFDGRTNSLICYPQAKDDINLYEVPATTKTIGANAFYNASAKLQRIFFNKNVTNIDPTAFNDAKLQSIGVSNDNTVYCSDFNNMATKDDSTAKAAVLYKKIAEKSVEVAKYPQCRPVVEGMQEVDANDKLTLKTSVKMGDVTKIGNYAFQGVKSISGIAFPNTVTSIGNHAFDSCQNDKFIILEIPNSIISIGEFAFNNCNTLQSITISGDEKQVKGVSSIGKGAFNNCTKLTSINVAGKNTFSNGIVNGQSDGVLYKTETIQVQSADKKTTTPVTKKTLIRYPSAKKGNDTDTTFTLKDASISEIAPYAFQGLNEISQINLSAKVTKVGEGAFADCSKLSDVTNYDNVSSLGDYAFENCVSLNPIQKLPTKLEILNANVFNNCPSITDLQIPTDIRYIYNTAFDGCANLKNITIPKSTDTNPYIYNVTIDKDGKEVKTKLENSKYYTDDGILYIKNINANTLGLVRYPMGKAEATYTIKPDIDNTNIVSIYNNAFKNCSNLINVNIIKKVFTGTKRPEMIELNTPINIAEDVFDENCNITFTSQVFDEECFDYDTVDGGTHIVITKLLADADTVYIPSEIAGKTVTKIAADAFAGRKINELVIPASIIAVEGDPVSKISGLTKLTIDPSNAYFKAEGTKMVPINENGGSNNDGGNNQQGGNTSGGNTSGGNTSGGNNASGTADNHGIFALGSLFTAAIAGTFLSRKKKNN